MTKKISDFIDHLNSRREFLLKFSVGSIMAGTIGGTALASVPNKHTLPKKDNALIWDPYNYGAKGDGKTLDTKAIQTAIDRCSEAGGGTVYLYSGCYISGSIYMKSNVILYLDAGTVLKGSNNLDDFESIPSKYTSWTSEMVTHKKFIHAEDQRNITICGRGTIDCNGLHWLKVPRGNPSFSAKPRGILFQGCENVRVSDITLYNAPTWMMLLQSCKNIVVDGITIDSNTEGISNQDGIDILDCQFARISNCYVNSGDDAIVLKSFSPDERCGNITITNCVVKSHTSGLKIGTETAGTFEDIIISNCTVYDTRGEGISLISVDGARIERILVSNITLRNLGRSSIFIRLGDRARPYLKNANLREGTIRDIIIENIQGTGIAMAHGCLLTGIPDKYIENVVLRNINLEFEGGGKLEDAARQVPEFEAEYPAGSKFGVIPSYGFFMRHVQNVVLDQINLRYVKEDFRPAVVCDDVKMLQIRNLQAQCNSQTPALISLKSVHDSIISNCKPANNISVFVKLIGNDSTDISLVSNQLKNAKQNTLIEDDSIKSEVKEYGTIK